MRGSGKTAMMTNVTRWIAAIVAVLPLASGAEVKHLPQNVVERETITVDGLEREFAYYVPSGAGDKPLPIVIALHGHGGRMQGMIGKGLLAYPDAFWMDVAEREKFLVFYPQGANAPDRKSGWNDCRMSSKANPDTDDVRFLSELMEFARKKFKVDDDRIYIAGVSNGGFMAFRMALERSESLAAVAAVVAMMAKGDECPAKPAQPVSVLIMYGTKDKLVPAAGGQMIQGRGNIYSAEETIDMWRKWDSLSDVKGKSEDLPDIEKDDSSRVRRTVYSRGAGKPEVVVYRIEGGGHTGPSKKIKAGRLIQMFVGAQNQDLEMVEVIWDFFKSQRRSRGAGH